MKTIDDKSEGKTSIHRPKTMFTKYLSLAISFREKIKNFHIIIVCCYSTFSDFFLNFATIICPKKCKE